MLRIKQIISLLAIVLLFNSCYVDNIDEQVDATKLNEAQIQQYIQNNNLSSTIKKTTSGLYYAITDDSQSTGQAINKGDSVYVHFTARLVSGTLIDTTSEKRNRPDKYWVGVNPVTFANIPYTLNPNARLLGLEEGIKLMKEGQRATIIIPSNLGLGAGSQSFVPPYSVLVYDLKVINVKSQDEQIQEYLDRKKLTVTLAGDSGLLYIRRVEGIANTKPVAGQEIVVNYKGTRLNDVQVDAGSQDSTFIVTIDKSNVIRGWHKGLRLMNQEEKATLIIPYKLAYDTVGSGSSIPPYSPLMFEMSWTKTEKTRILDYIKTNAWTDTVKTTSGLYYRIEQAVPETNTKPSDTDSVRVKLTANYLLSDGSFSDPIYNNTLVDFRLNNTSNLALILGLKEGILLMRKGERRRLIMPSNLGFGSLGRSGFKVPGKTPVVYIVELVETGLTK